MPKMCEYGCGNTAKYIVTSKNKWCCSKHYQQCPAIRSKNSKGLKNAHSLGKMRKFTDEDRKKSNENKIKNAIKKAFTKNSSYTNEYLKPYFIKFFNNNEEKCAICGISEWNGKKLVLELDHIDGDRTNNDPSNLRLLCPNCHSQTETFRGRNKNKGKKIISDEKLIEALKNEKSIRQALIKVGLAPKGANYNRAKKLLNGARKGTRTPTA